MPSKPPRHCLASAALLWLGVGCGPSMQVLHEGAVRFEHCHRLDFDERIAPSHRKACWRAWTERYSYGQPRDRIEYAERRIQAIDRNEPPPDLGLHVAPERASLVEPADPTDAHAPPPPVATPVELGLASEGPTAEGPTTKGPSTKGPATKGPEIDAPGDACAQSCRSEHVACLETCRPDDAIACPCERAYRACMVGCFDDD